jgi:hypothetical protein
MIDLILANDYVCGVGWTLRKCTSKEILQYRLRNFGILFVWLLFLIMTGILIYRKVKKLKLSKNYYFIYIIVILVTIFSAIVVANGFAPSKVIY